MAGRLPAVERPGSARYRSRAPANGPVPCAGNEVVPRKQLFRPCGERAFFVSVDLVDDSVVKFLRIILLTLRAFLIHETHLPQKLFFVVP